MTLPDSIAWQSPNNRTSGISSASVSNNAGYVGSGIDNSINKDQYADIEIEWSFAVAPTANKSLLTYLIHSIDGTNYEDGDASTQPSSPIVLAVSPPPDTSTHRRMVARVPIPPQAFKALVWNEGTGQTATVTVTIETYRDEIVD